MSVHTAVLQRWRLTVGVLLLLTWANAIQAYELVVRATLPDASPASGVAIQKVLNGIGSTDSDGVFETAECYLSDVAAKISITKYESSDAAPLRTYDVSFIDMNGFDPARDYVVELPLKED